MTAPRLVVLLAAAAAALAIAALARPASGRSANAVLIGKVGLHNRYSISLTFPNGRRVRSLAAGTYTLVVHDYSSIHNFALGSQTRNKRLLTTGVPWIGTKTYHLKLMPGSYAYACSAHPTTMNGTFVVTAGP